MISKCLAQCCNLIEIATQQNCDDHMQLLQGLVDLDCPEAMHVLD